MATPWLVPRRACLAVVLVAFAGCSNSATTHPASSARDIEAATVESSTTTSLLSALSDADLANVLAVAVPAAIAADPDGFGKVVETTTYVIADTFGQLNGNSVTFSSESVPLSGGVRAAVEAALSPATAAFVPADISKWMLLLAEPTVGNDAVVVSYEQRCGGEPDALCGSGGAFRLERVGGSWSIAKVLSAWIS